MKCINLEVKAKAPIIIASNGDNDSFSKMKDGCNSESPVLISIIQPNTIKGLDNLGDISSMAASSNIDDVDNCDYNRIYVVALTDYNKIVYEALRSSFNSIFSAIKSQKIDYDMVYIDFNASIKKDDINEISVLVSSMIPKNKDSVDIIIDTGYRSNTDFFTLSSDCDDKDTKKKHKKKNKNKKKK